MTPLRQTTATGGRFPIRTKAASVIGLLMLVFGFSNFSFTQACDYYASPSGGGNGLSPEAPFQIFQFWPVAGPGKTLCLLDGVYSDSKSNINPPIGLSGTASAPITVRALNDGAVRIDGQNARNPILLVENSYFVIEGVNAHNSSGSVVYIGRSSDNNIIRRVVGWDAADKNTTIFGTHGNTGTLFEDVAGFGVARKIFAFSQYGDNATCRRCWGRWEGSTSVGPKLTYTYAYNNYNATLENVLGTWNEGSMPASYVLQANGEVWTGNGAGVRTNVDQPYAVIGSDHLKDSKLSGTRIIASLSYIQKTDRVRGFHGGVTCNQSTDKIVFNNVASYIEPGFPVALRPFYMNIGQAMDCTLCERRFENNTDIGGILSPINQKPPNGWTVTNHADADTVSAAPNIWTGAGPAGARLCKRTVNRKLTNEPLWPWPMNQRILDATTLASSSDHHHVIYQGDPPRPTLVKNPHVPVDVTATLEAIFGPIPAECRSDKNDDGPGVHVDESSLVQAIRSVFKPLQGESGEVQIKADGHEWTAVVVDRFGQKVRDGLEATPGEEFVTLKWNGRTNQGGVAASGAYTLILQFKNATYKQKMVVVK